MEFMVEIKLEKIVHQELRILEVLEMKIIILKKELHIPH
jgi:hypothetical protein